MKKILFPTDFSELSINAFTYALDWAHRLNASVDVIHIKDLTFDYKVELEQDIANFENNVSKFDKFDQFVKERNMDHLNIHYSIFNQDFLETIVDEISSNDYFMVVMGTEGVYGLKEVFVQTNTVKVLKSIDTFLCAVPNEAMFDGELNKILFLTEFGMEEDAQALDQIAELASDINAQIDVVHFDTAHTDGITKNKEKFEQAFVNSHNVEIKFDSVNSLDLEKSIAQYCEKEEIDVVYVVNHKRNYFQRLFHYNLAIALINHSETPVLTYTVD